MQRGGGGSSMSGDAACRDVVVLGGGGLHKLRARNQYETGAMQSTLGVPSCVQILKGSHIQGDGSRVPFYPRLTLPPSAQRAPEKVCH